jgi:serine protease Do
MRKALVFFLALFTACATHRPEPLIIEPEPAAHLQVVNRRSLVKQMRSQNVRVLIHDGETLKRTASGVVIACELTPSGYASYVLTNSHVLAQIQLEKPRFTIVSAATGEEIEHSAAVMALSETAELNLAILRVLGARLPAADLAGDDEAEPGEDIIVAAAPYGRPISFSGGMISQIELDRKTQAPGLIRTDAAIGYGASGGGVYSVSTGKLLALVEGYRTARVNIPLPEQAYSFEVPVPGETYAIPTAKVRRFLKENRLERLVMAGNKSEVSVRGVR